MKSKLACEAARKAATEAAEENKRDTKCIDEVLEYLKTVEYHYCCCDKAYKARKLISPYCMVHDIKTELEEIIMQYSSRETKNTNFERLKDIDN